MRTPEKNPNLKAYIDVPMVQKRVFERFFNEHSGQQLLLNDSFPEYCMTNLELSGIAAKISFLDIDYKFEHIADELAAAIKILSNLPEPEYEGQFVRAPGCIHMLVELLRTFDWMSAYGPAVNPAAKKAD